MSYHDPDGTAPGSRRSRSRYKFHSLKIGGYAVIEGDRKAKRSARECARQQGKTHDMAFRSESQDDGTLRIYRTR